ncbi:RluA family pseudouridine synthase [soil metagenome]
MSSGLQILFEDNHVLAVAKPAPLLTQSARAESAEPVTSLELLVREHIRTRYSKPGNVYLGIPHRLDRPVSGVVVFARNSKAARRLAEQFRERQVTKEYWAAVEGAPTTPTGTWETWLRKVPDQARAEVTEPGSPGARSARTRYRVLTSLPDRTLLELVPETGRMHQLRLQCSQAGMPVIGDELYGSTLPFGPSSELTRDRIVALHARRLSILHPISFERLVFTAPLPEYWLATNLPLPPAVFKSLNSDPGPRSPISG